MNGLTKIQLDLMAANGCEIPDCTHDHSGEIFLRPRCHVNRQPEVSYTRGSGVLIIACSECHRLVAAIAVKES